MLLLITRVGLKTTLYIYIDFFKFGNTKSESETVCRFFCRALTMHSAHPDNGCA